MKINEEIKTILETSGIPYDDGICHLLCLYYDITPSIMNEEIGKKLNTTGIYGIDEVGFKWSVPLFEGVKNVVGDWDWVKTEYVTLFKDANPERGGKVREATARMKKLFSAHPAIRKEEILGATRMYINNEDFRYIRFPHYFIEKGVGDNKIEDLLDWVDKYKEQEAPDTERNSLSNTIQ